MPNWYETINAGCCLLDQTRSFPHDIISPSPCKRERAAFKTDNSPSVNKKNRKKKDYASASPRVQTTPGDWWDWWEETWLLLRCDCDVRASVNKPFTLHKTAFLVLFSTWRLKVVKDFLAFT